MKVKMLACTPHLIDVIYTGARTCYNVGSPIDMWSEVERIPEDKKLKLIKAVIESGHSSTCEHVYFTFAVEGVSRSLLAQLSRHRFCSLSVQSQRYVEFKEDMNKLEYMFIHNQTEDLKNILSKYFVDVNDDNMNGFYYALNDYLHNVKNGMKPEDARAILPNATKTNLVMSCNLRELMHVCGLRRCTRAQLEIRKLFTEIAELVVEQEPWLKEYLGPKCVQQGFCDESKSCGRMPKLK